MDREELIIERVINGDKHSYKELVSRYQGLAYSLSFRVIKNSQEAEEVAQESFIKAYKALSKFDRRSKFSTWLFRIVYNTAISHIRKRKNVETFEVEKHRATASDPKILEESDRKRYIKEAMDKLKPEDATVLTLFYLREHSIQEISEIMDIKESNVKIKLFRSRKKMGEELRRILKDEVLTL